jgi:hypothetical protein
MCALSPSPAGPVVTRILSFSWAPAGSPAKRTSRAPCPAPGPGTAARALVHARCVWVLGLGMPAVLCRLARGRERRRKGGEVAPSLIVPTAPPTMAAPFVRDRARVHTVAPSQLPTASVQRSRPPESAQASSMPNACSGPCAAIGAMSGAGSPTLTSKRRARVGRGGGRVPGEIWLEACSMSNERVSIEWPPLSEVPHGRKPQRHFETRSGLPGQGIGELNRRFMQLGDGSDEAQAQTATGCGAALVQADKAFEHLAAEVRGDASAVVQNLCHRSGVAVAGGATAECAGRGQYRR